MFVSIFEGLQLSGAYAMVIGAALVIISSYFCNIIARKTNIPSPLLLIGLGLLIKVGLEKAGIGDLPFQNLILELLGTVGLIFIVLEAALDLKLSKDKWPVIWRSLVVALLALVVSSFLIAWIFNLLIFHDSMIQSLVYAIPLSIMSSAIIIPSVVGLSEDRKEFMVYESTFSDILGIMFFYLLLGNATETSTGSVIMAVVLNIFLTLVLSLVVCYALVFVLVRIPGQLKLFLTISVMLLLYVLGKLMHLSPLVLILVFGLMLNNHKVFWRGPLRNLLDKKKIRTIGHDFHILTLESAFVIRTFFFVIFGMTIVLSHLLKWEVAFYAMLVTLSLYLVRLLFLVIFKRKDIFPLLYIAPRGLITILLFFSISSSYPEFESPLFDQGILLFVIMASSIVMTISLIQHGLRPDVTIGVDDPYDHSENEPALPPSEDKTAQ